MEIYYTGVKIYRFQLYNNRYVVLYTLRLNEFFLLSDMVNKVFLARSQTENVSFLSTRKLDELFLDHCYLWLIKFTLQFFYYKEIELYWGAIFFERSVHTYSLFYKSSGLVILVPPQPDGIFSK